MTGLKFLSRNLFACLQEVISSFRLLSEAKSGLQIIKYFSHRHKLQRFEAGLYGAACFRIFHVIWNFVLVSFNCQMYLEGGIGAYQKPKNRPKFSPKPKNRKKKRSKPKKRQE